MIDERTEEAAAMYAFDLLEGNERAAFESSLASDPGLRVLVEELRATTTALAALAPSSQPPAGLKSRVMASVSSKAGTDSRSDDRKVVPFRLAAWTGWAAAASFAVVAAVLAQLYVSNQTQLSIAQAASELARLESESTRQVLEAERILTERQIASLRTAEARVVALEAQANLANLKISSLASMLGNSPEAQAIAVWSPSTQQGVLAVEKLPALDADKDYQLWVIDPQYPIPVDGGVFTVDERGGARLAFHPKQPIAQVAKFAVSLERKGGVPKAEGPMVLISP